MPSLVRLDLANDTDLERWQSYVLARPDTQYADLGQWRRVFTDLYGIQTVDYACVDAERTVGVVSCYLIASPFFGRLLVTCPFFGASGGLYADDPETEQRLLHAIDNAAHELDVDFIELRLRRPLLAPYEVATDFLEFELALDAPSDEIWKRSLSSNARQNIRKAQKHELEFALSTEVEETFLLISQTIRDLGTPFHPRRFFELVRHHLPDEVCFSHVRLADQLIAAGVVVRFRDRISTPYIGSLVAHRSTCANYAQYWGIIEHGLASGARCFDLGRSPRGSAHQSFKEKWGATAVTPHYNHRAISRRREHRSVLERNRLELLASDVWKRLPLAATRRLGHLVARYIP